uniref:Uncharacterized protein n=1 Tax=Ananas comosus var. bracteatus TaxID=296719 RepID=A0A6V7QHY2_ANACO|nr:unnamed protein product [Ananas comosus var. bracteatus]
MGCSTAPPTAFRRRPTRARAPSVPCRRTRRPATAGHPVLHQAPSIWETDSRGFTCGDRALVFGVCGLDSNPVDPSGMAIGLSFDTQFNDTAVGLSFDAQFNDMAVVLI